MKCDNEFCYMNRKYGGTGYSVHSSNEEAELCEERIKRAEANSKCKCGLASGEEGGKGGPKNAEWLNLINDHAKTYTQLIKLSIESGNEQDLLDAKIKLYAINALYSDAESGGLIG